MRDLYCDSLVHYDRNVVTFILLFPNPLSVSLKWSWCALQFWWCVQGPLMLLKLCPSSLFSVCSSSPPFLTSSPRVSFLPRDKRAERKRHEETFSKMRRWRLILKLRHLKNEVWQSCIIFVFMTSSSCSSSGGASLSWSWWRECVFESSSNRLICSSVFFLIIFISPQEIHFYMCQMVCVGKPRQILTI